MKKICFFAALTALMIGAVSCTDNNEQEEINDYRIFVGTWGLKQIDYYFVDYFGQPIEEERETWDFIPGDTINGIDLVFKSDKTGLRIDRSHDTLFFLASVNPVTYDTIVCIDTILYAPFNYSYDAEEKMLYMTTTDDGKTHAAKIVYIDENGFRYYNQYKVNGNDYAEDAVLERIPDAPSRVAPARRKVVAPHKPGSFLFNQ